MPIPNPFVVLSLVFLLAHDDYPVECCTGKDCRPVPCAEIIQIDRPNYPPQWRHGTTIFGENSIRTPIDERCHVCKSAISGRCIMFPRPKTS